MLSLNVRGSVRALLIGVCLINVSWAADSKSASGSSKSPTSSQRSSSARPGAGRGTLPDPALLDGSTHPAEKKSEYGMIGDFELPGDENVRNGKVGGPQTAGQTQPPQGGGAMGLPQAGGAAGQQQQSGQGGQQGGGQPPAGPQNPSAAGQQVAGAGDPNAKPEGVQVAQLGGESAADQSQGAGAGEKPPPVAIGDQGMQIQTAASNRGTVGGQQLPGNTQHHEKGTGTGGKAPTGAQGNNRIEKGRTIPAGL
jgi:hypothetical protein